MTYWHLCHRLHLLSAVLVPVLAQILQTSSGPPDIHTFQTSASPSSSHSSPDHSRETTAMTPITLPSKTPPDPSSAIPLAHFLTTSEKTADSFSDSVPFSSRNTDSSDNETSRDNSYDTSDNDSPFTSDSEIENEAEFWKQTAAAYYDFCRKTCNPLDNLNSERNCLPCWCDGACTVYGDCCPDVYAKLGHQPLSGWRNGSVRCSRTSFGSSVTLDYVMMTQCPADADRSLTVKCESMVTSHWNLTRPVTDIESFVTYKNRYCALCHSAARIQPWEVKIAVVNPATVIGITSRTELYRAVVSDVDNEVFYTCPSSFADHARKCSLEPLTSHCNVTGEWANYDGNVERACLLLTAPIKHQFKGYKNPFCYLCNTWKNWTEVSGHYEEEGMHGNQFLVLSQARRHL